MGKHYWLRTTATSGNMQEMSIRERRFNRVDRAFKVDVLAGWPSGLKGRVEIKCAKHLNKE